MDTAADKNADKNARPRPPGPAVAEVPKLKPIPLGRMAQMAHVSGDMLNVTLVEDETIDEGVQDVERWRHIGGKLSANQWVQVTNDAMSMYRLMRVEMVHGSPSTGLRALVLRDIVPPRFFEREHEPVVATGNWYVRYLGMHKRWAVISPSGVCRLEGINSEAEARNIMLLEDRNPAAR